MLGGLVGYLVVGSAVLGTEGGVFGFGLSG